MIVNIYKGFEGKGGQKGIVMTVIGTDSAWHEEECLEITV